MKKTEELAEKIKPKLIKHREEQVEFLWKDFLESIERIINKLPENILYQTRRISILYEINQKEAKIYRSKFAEIDNDGEMQYELNDTLIGSIRETKSALIDFAKRAKSDYYCCTSCFKSEWIYDFEMSDILIVEFWLEKIEIKPQKNPKTKRKIVIE